MNEEIWTLQLVSGPRVILMGFCDGPVWIILSNVDCKFWWKAVNLKKKQHIDILARRPRKIDILFWKPFKNKLETVILHSLLIVLLVGIEVLSIIQTFCRARGTWLSVFKISHTFYVLLQINFQKNAICLFFFQRVFNLGCGKTWIFCFRSWWSVICFNCTTPMCWPS